MKQVIKILGKSSIWNDLLGLVALAGLIFTHDAKSLIVFGIVYLGSCMRER